MTVTRRNEDGVRVVECEQCGQELELHSSWANECECGVEYNGFGQMLAPRDQWGYETGETESDFLSMESGAYDHDFDY